MSLNQLLQLLRGPRPVPPAYDAPSSAFALPSTFVPSERTPASQLDRVDLQSALIHHLEWCVMFNDHLSSITPTNGDAPPPRTLPHAEQSGLGLWLQRSASRAPGQHPKFEALLKQHRLFHELAEEVLALAEEDRMDLASILINTDFERSRAKVLALLREMQQT